jgi:hypothetical protein
MSTSHLSAAIPPSRRLLSTTDFGRLAEGFLEIEWFANIDNPQIDEDGYTGRKRGNKRGNSAII